MVGIRKLRGGAVATVIALVAGLLAAGAIVYDAAPAVAAPGTPGTPSDPVELYLEDFESGGVTGVQELEDYVGAGGASYTADSYYLRAMRCNGFILQFDTVTTTPDGYCNKPINPVNNWRAVRAKAYALGLLTGNPETNRAVSSNTGGFTDDEVAGNDGTIQPSNNQRQFATIGDIDFPASANRFVTFSVDTAATACTSNHPLLNFFLRTAAGEEVPVSSSPINPCTDPRGTETVIETLPVRYGSFAADSSILLQGSSFGIVMRNSQSQSAGNDGAFDNIRVLDVTPQLDKSFSPSSVPVGGISTLTLTVTNTSELASKSGWAFTDTLPAGLVIASPPSVGGSCDAQVTAAAGSDTIAVTNGELATGEVSCTITVDVTSDTPAPSEPSPKVYENCAANISDVIGMDLPDCATVEFTTAPQLEIRKTTTATADSRAGDTVTYTVTATNTGTRDFTAGAPAVVFDDLSDVLDDGTYNGDATSSSGPPPAYAAPLLSWSGPLAVGESLVLTYTVDLTAAGDGIVRNVAWVPADPGSPEPPTCEAVDDGVDAETGEPCAATSQPLPRLSIDKSADRTELPGVGAQVEYTVVVRNHGPGAYTASAPATATDDLSAVLDDAVFDDASLTASTGEVSRDGDILSWTGALAADETATIRYAVTYQGEGDNRLRNTACVPVPQTAPGQASCDSVTIPGALLSQGKTAAPSSTPVVAGSTITYTLFFDNDGQAPADVDAVDDLTHVLDDADVTVEPSVSAGLSAVRSGSQITITGTVAAGERSTVTYVVTVRGDGERGDSVAANYILAPGETPPTDPVCVPGDAEEPDCTTTPITGVAYSKEVSASASPAQTGTELTYTILIVNTGATEVDVVRDDRLADVLDDAELTGAPASDTDSVTVTGPTDGVLALRGTLAAGETARVVYTVTVKPHAERGNSVADNFLVPPGTPPAEECDTDTRSCTSTPIQGYTVAKTADVESVLPGGVVTYTVSVTNVGTVAYTPERPAEFTDDLAAVLDDAVYNDDVSAGGSVSGSTLTWSGALAVGESIDVTYSVTVDDPVTGDGVLANAVVPSAPGGECEAVDACVVETPVASFTVAKEVDRTSAMAGDVIAYRVTVTNTGQVPYTESRPAAFEDDLSAVLDDAVYNDDVSTGGSVEGELLRWSGALAVGETLTVTYSVTVDEPLRGDRDLRNTVTPAAPGGSCADDEGCQTRTPIGSFAVTKSTDVASALPGDVVTYTVTVVNTGEVAYTESAPAGFSDDLSDVLDDAVYNGDATGGAAVAGARLVWSGPLAVGEERTVTYSVTVDDPVTGDFVLRNVVAPSGPGGECDVCATETPVGSYRVVKTTEAVEVVPGEVVEYTVTVTNTGAVDYTDAAPASFSDDLSRVLDDARYNGDAVSSTGAGVSYRAPELSWSGPLAVGESVSVTYSVTVDDPVRGDQRLENAVITPSGTGGNCVTGSDDPACVANVPAASFSVAKRVDRTSALAGDVVTYTVTVVNTGEVAYTEAEPASFSDDLSRVLDDAVYNGDVSEGGSVSGSTLTWSGALAVGETREVVYSVTVAEPGAGDLLLRNVVSPSSPGGACAADGCTTDTPVAAYVVSKTADVSDVVHGGVVRYEVVVTNTGQVDYTEENPASFRDDLSDVLDDARYNDDATEGGRFADGELVWEGPLAAGESIVVAYSVTVAREGGDRMLRNAVVPNSPGGGCDADGACVTETPVASYRVTKAVSTARASIGDRVGFTITVVNTGRVAYGAERPASFTDDLSSALALGSYNDDATAGAVYDAPVLSWEGALDVGETVVVTYSVTVRKAGDITNVVVTPGDAGANCAEGSSDADCVTETTVVPPPLPVTGGTLWAGGGIAGAVLVAFGALLWITSRRRAQARGALALP